MKRIFIQIVLVLWAVKMADSGTLFLTNSGTSSVPTTTTSEPTTTTSEPTTTTSEPTTTTTAAEGAYSYSTAAALTNQGSGYAETQQAVTCGQTGNITKIGLRIYENDTSDKIELALYNSAGTSMLGTCSLSAPYNTSETCAIAGWNECSISSVAVSATDVVRVAFRGCIGDTGNGNFAPCKATTGTGTYYGTDIANYCAGFPPANLSGIDEDAESLIYVGVYIE